MASGVYDRLKYNLFRGLADLGGGSGAHQLYVMLLTSSHVFVAANNTYASISQNEVAAGGGYTTGGQLLTGVTVTQNDGATQAVFTGSNTTWGSSTITAAFAVIYDHTLISKDLIACFDFGGSQSSSSGNFTVQWAGAGIVTLS